MKSIFLICSIAISVNCFSQSLCKQHLHSNDALRSMNDAERSVSSANFDVTFYRCFFENTPNVRTIKGYVTSKFKMLSAGDTVAFDLKSNLIVDSVRFRNALITFNRNADRLKINFPVILSANTNDSVTVFYQGNPSSTDGYFATGTHAGNPITYTLSEPYGARYWFPCKDNLNDKADSIEVTLKYPNTYTGVANGVLVSETNTGGFKTSTWMHRKPIAAYLVAFAITNYTKDVRSLTSNGNPIPFINYYYPESATSYSNSVTALTTAFANFEAKFGPYPFNNEQYSQTQIQNGAGGMEHQVNSFVDSWGAGLGAHELMHQWFGNKVTCNSWKEIWLNEGFASYGEVIYSEGVGGATARINEMKSRATSINSNSTGSVYRTDTNTVASIFNYRLSYLKASYVVHMLRWYLGDNAFYQSCRNYLNAPGVSFGFATTDTLKKYMEQGLAGGGNLTEFFNDWVYGQGYPTYTINWNQTGNNFVVKADQVSANAAVSFYEMPIPVKLIGATRDTTVRLMHNSNGQLFYFTVSFPVTSVQFDPEAWVLSRNNTTAQDASLATTGISNIIIDKTITVGPVPATDKVYIYNPNNRIFKAMQIFDVNGKMVVNTNGVSNAIDISHLPKGNYTMKLIDKANKVIVRKIVK